MAMLQLYEANMRGETGNRVCPLPDCTEATVRREVNGAYTLTAKLPEGARFLRAIEIGRAVKARVNEEGKEQYFIIKRAPRQLGGGVSIYAEHQSYYYNGVLLGSGPVNSGASVESVFNHIRTYARPDITDLTVWSYQRTSGLTANFPLRETPMQLSQILKTWLIAAAGGELDFDGYSVIWADALGSDRGAVYRYGVNLREMETDDVLDNYATGIYPYWGRRSSTSQPITILNPPILNYSGSFPLEVIVPVDLTTSFDTQPTAAELQAAAEDYMTRHTPTGIPKALKIARERLLSDNPVDLGDTVTVVNDRWGVSAKVRVNALELDPLSERVRNVEVGAVNLGLAGSIKNLIFRKG